MIGMRWVQWMTVVCLVGCGEAGGEGVPSDGEGGDDGSGGDGPLEYDPYMPEVDPTGWRTLSGGGVSNPGGRCPDQPGAVPMRLPATDVEYCVQASPECAHEGADCPLYVTINTDGAFFGREGQFITVELYTETDGDGVKDKLAELPRVIAYDYPGLDRERVYAVGWSAGAGAVKRGLCHISKKSDHSEHGTTSDIYAAIVALGGCGCDDYVQLEGNWHSFSFNGTDDQFNGGDACEETLRLRAHVNGCDDLDATWMPLEPDDPYARNGDGSDNAERLHFGDCERGEVVGYRGRDEGHVLSFKKHFDPKISGYDAAWSFLQGKTKH